MNSLVATTPRYAGRIWPTGKFGVSRVREAPFLSSCQSHYETAESQFNSLGIKAHGVEAVLRFRNKWEAVVDPDLSNVSNSPIVSKKRGHGGITRYGRNLISSAAVIVERNYDRRILTFCTVTLPSAPLESLQSVCGNWSEIVKQFVKNLGRGLLSANLPPQVFGVTEVQMKRFEAHGVPALHLHLVFVGRNSRKNAWQVTRKDVRRWWVQCLKKYLPPDTDYSSVENVQQVRKSAASYLGKYMSKGTDAIAAIIAAGFADWLPSAWFTISHDLRREVLSNVLRGENVGELLNWLCHNVMANVFRWIAPVLIKRSDQSEYAIGFTGSLLPEALDKVRKSVLGLVPNRRQVI